MPMPPELRERVRDWGARSGIVLVLKDGRVVDTVRVLKADPNMVYVLRGREREYDDLWFKVFPVGELVQREEEYRAKYKLERRLTKN